LFAFYMKGILRLYIVFIMDGFVKSCSQYRLGQLTVCNQLLTMNNAVDIVRNISANSLIIVQMLCLCRINIVPDIFYTLSIIQDGSQIKHVSVLWNHYWYMRNYILIAFSSVIILCIVHRILLWQGVCLVFLFTEYFV
jgi:hypothetical protein